MGRTDMNHSTTITAKFPSYSIQISPYMYYLFFICSPQQKVYLKKIKKQPSIAYAFPVPLNDLSGAQEGATVLSEVRQE